RGDGESGARASIAPRDMEEAMDVNAAKKPGRQKKMPGEETDAPAPSRPGWEGVVIVTTKTETGKMPGEGGLPQAAKPAGMPGEGGGVQSSMAAKAVTKRVPTQHVLVPRDATAETAAPAAADLAGDTPGGSTAHFSVFYDPALGADGPT